MTSPGYLVVSAGMLVLSAATYSSPHEKAVSTALGLLSIAFVLAYLLSRKALLTFQSGSVTNFTQQASLSEIAAVIKALQVTQGSESPLPEYQQAAQLHQLIQH